MGKEQLENAVANVIPFFVEGMIDIMRYAIDAEREVALSLIATTEAVCKDGGMNDNACVVGQSAITAYTEAFNTKHETLRKSLDLVPQAIAAWATLAEAERLRAEASLLRARRDVRSSPSDPEEGSDSEDN